MLDSLGQRYGCLPSEILAKGDVLDISIMIKSIAWHNERESRRQEGLSMPNNQGYTTEQLLSKLNRVKEGKK
jgi:hypothetical protein